MDKRILLVLLSVALIQSSLAYNGGDDKLEYFNKQLRTFFCIDVKDGRDCNIPDIFDDRLGGICCGGYCVEGVSKCGQTFDEKSFSNVGWILSQKSCENRKENDECDIPKDLKAYVGIGDTVCCNGMCEVDVKDCEDLYRDRGPPQDIEQGMKELEFMSCIGKGDGEKCDLPDDLTDWMNISGVCCSGRCAYRATECIDKPDLIITEINLDPDDPTPKETIEMKIVIQNIGKIAVNEFFWVEFKSDVNATPKHYYLAQKPKPGDYVDFQGTLEYKEGGNYTIEATVDRHMDESKNNLVAESDEENNVFTLGLSVMKAGRVSKKGNWMFGDGICEFDSGESYDESPCDCHPPDGKAVCGNGCCEPDYGESYEKCPQDCMAPGGKEIIVKEEPNESDTLVFALVAFIAILTLIVVMMMVTKSFGKEKQGGIPPEIPPAPDYELELKKLTDEKKSIEDMITLAQLKFHKRKLDEESFREIVRDQQKRLIEIEAKMSEMEGRVSKIEEKESN